MKQKSNEKNESGKNESKNIRRNLSKDASIFETTYEKVLSIINKVKDFIKKTSKTSQQLIDDLEWVIKVIANKSLYSYEVNKNKIDKKNSEYNKFINFVTKYNEEVLEMNKKHILVSSLLNIGKREDILLKPSLCLNKILPKELQSLDYKLEKEKKAKKKKSITLIGNIILNLYYRGLEKQKKEKEEEEKAKLENKDKIQMEVKKDKKKEEEKSKIENKSDIKVEKKIETKEGKINLKKIQTFVKKEIKVQERRDINSASFNTPQIKKFKKMKTSNPNKVPIIDNDKRSSIDIRNKMKGKLVESNISYTQKKENMANSQITLNKKLTLTSIKKAMQNYYNTHLDLIDNKERRKSYYIDKESVLGKNMKKNNISQPVINNLKEKNIEVKKNLNFKKIDNTKIINKKIEKKQEKKEKPILSLIDQFFNEIKGITDKDFNIFNFKKVVGHRNVLPIMCHVILKTLGLNEPKIISLKKLDSFLYAVSDGYKETTLYHNSLHGADITQSLCIFFLNSNAEEISEITVLDLLGIIISAMGHDLGHPGYNNGYHVNARTELALTYNDISCLENYHTSFLFRILSNEENNIFEKLNTQNYKNIRKRMISQILATDMANHGEAVSLIRAKIKASEDEGEERFNLLSGNEKTKFDEQQILLNYLIHAADLGHNCKKFEISIEWVKLLTEEFWLQGDMEKAKGIPVSFLCDRDKIDIPSSQVGFLKGFILTTFDCLVAMFPSLNYTMENANNNIKQWKSLLDQHRARGWTPKKDEKEEKKK
jgi:hypothetical protein